MKEQKLTVVVAAETLEDRAELRAALSRDSAALYEFIEADSGARTVEVCRARKPDCLIVDLDKRDLSDALKQLAGENQEIGFAVVALVAAGDAQFVAEAMKSGANDCLEKHRARGKTILNAVHQTIEKAEQRRARERELIEKNRELEASLDALNRQAASRAQIKEVWQAASAGATASGAVVSRPEKTNHILDGERLRLLTAAIEQSDESVIIMTSQLDPPGPRIVYINPAFTRMTGYASGDVMGKTLNVVRISQTDLSALIRMCEDCASGNSSRVVITIYRKDRSDIKLESSICQVRDERGATTHFVITQRDVTQQRRVEEDLRRSEEEFRSLFDLSATGMAQVSPEGRYLHVNRKLCQMLGYTEEELLNLTLHEVTHPDDRELTAARLSSSFSREPEEYSIEKRCIRKDGATIWILINWTIVRAAEGHPPRTVANIQDITARKLAEERLRAKEAQIRAILDHSPAIIFVKDLKGRYRRINRRYELLKGVTEAEVKGKTDYDLYAKEIADHCRANDQEVIAADSPHQFEEQATFADGLHDFIVVKFPLRTESGRPYAICGIATDITERKRAETALRVSQALNQAVLDSLASNIAVLDRDGKIIAVNEDWRRFARENEVADLAVSVNVNYLSVCRRAIERGNDEAKAAIDGIQAVLNGERSSFTLEYSCDSPTEKRWFQMSVTPLGGARRGVVVAHTNISTRRLAEEAILESESRLRQLADAMPQIVYTCGPDGIVDYGNQRWSEYVGVPMEQSIRYKWMEVVHPDDLEGTKDRMREAGETGRSFETEYRLRRKDGQFRWYLARAIPIRNAKGQIVKWIGTATDIHDRKEAEAEREVLLAREREARAEAEHSAESIRRFQALTDSALSPLTLDDLLREMLAHIKELLATDSAAIFLLTEDGQFLSVSATIGWGEDATGFDVPVGQGVAGAIAASRAPLVVNDVSTLDQLVLPRNARSLIGAPLIVEGRLIGVIRSETTRLRRFSEEDVRLLQLAADRVALAVDHTRLYEIELQARRQAEEANRMKDEFLALVSHELRSPLNAILGYASLMRYGEHDAKQVNFAASVIERNGKAQAQLIDDLLDTARIISGKLRIEVGPVDLVSVIEQAVQTIHAAADAKGISIETDLPSEIGQITGDPARLQQVIWNLLSNAVKFTPHGGRVEARLERLDPYICITVRDTGKGISLDFLPFVFDRFRQADASSARRYGGLGLGLALVKYLVELHGGTIEAESSGEGEGATFTVTLPVRAVTTPLGDTGVEPALKQTGELSGVRALVVDDEDNARELLEMALRQYGADVVAVSSAAEAYTLITESPKRERPGVIVSDIGMPGEDGYSLMRRVREWERESGSYIPAVALTAYGRSDDRLRALRAGFQMHVAKPVEPAELSVVITSLITRPKSGKK